MSEDEVKQMLRDAIDQNPEGTVWHVNTKHLVVFAQMVADKTRKEMEPPTSIKEKLGMIDLADVKGYARVKGFGDVAILSGDVGGLTFVARWVRSDSITDRTEEFYWGKESDDGADEENL